MTSTSGSCSTIGMSSCQRWGKTSGRRLPAALRPGTAGTYSGVGTVPMAGRWDATVTVRRGGQLVGTRQFALVTR